MKLNYNIYKVMQNTYHAFMHGRIYGKKMLYDPIAKGKGLHMFAHVYTCSVDLLWAQSLLVVL